MKFLIFHGAFGNPDNNWLPDLKEKLEALGQTVLSPAFPVDDWDALTASGKNSRPKKQTLQNWLNTFENVLKKIGKKETLCFIGHSLAPLFILHAVEKFNVQLDSAIFVSPFLQKLNRAWQIDLVNASFYKTDFDWGKLQKLIPTSYVLYSDNDPYVDAKQSIAFAEKLKSSLIFVKHAGHMNAKVNLNEFGLVGELCKTRLDLSLYQRYLAHRRELYALNYADSKIEETVYLPPEEMFAEGKFHFRNLKTEGFCTFLTSLDFWNHQSKYMEEARKAAKRMKNLTRVFLVNKASDLKKTRLRKQIALDVKAGIKVYLCDFTAVKKFLKFSDFGIWDSSYVCMVEFKNQNEIKRVKLDSRKSELNKACKQKDVILKNAARIYNLNDVSRWMLKHA